MDEEQRGTSARRSPRRGSGNDGSEANSGAAAVLLLPDVRTAGRVASSQCGGDARTDHGVAFRPGRLRKAR